MKSAMEALAEVPTTETLRKALYVAGFNWSKQEKPKSPRVLDTDDFYWQFRPGEDRMDAVYLENPSDIDTANLVHYWEARARGIVDFSKTPSVFEGIEVFQAILVYPKSKRRLKSEKQDFI